MQHSPELDKDENFKEHQLIANDAHFATHVPLEPQMLMVGGWSDETLPLLPSSLSTHYPTKQFVLTKPQVGGGIHMAL